MVIGVLASQGIIQGSGGDESEADESASDAEPTSQEDESPSADLTACTPADDIPSAHRGTDLDPSTWLTTSDFNCTFTAATVGSLPVMGLFTSYNDSTRANPSTPPLNEPWGSYATRPARGVNLGGWLSIEPFITPSLFAPHVNASVVDEYTLCAELGSSAAAVLEEHYATFVTEADFAAMAAAGLDHVRIPFSYWAVETYDADDAAYVARVSWRYLLRAIEWARKHGLRVKLDVHGLPGSQNGWNHSGRAGDANWIQGPDGDLNRARSLEMHDKLSKFFAQPRYQNIIAFYGQANEPGHDVPKADVIAWTAEVHDLVSANGITATQVFGEAFQGLTSWQGELQGYNDSLAIDAHQYLIFAPGLLAQPHADKIAFVCSALAEQSTLSFSTDTGFGPTIIGEWSQADTDCTGFLNGVGDGARWDGTYSDSDGPGCPAADDTCSCEKANEDPGGYSDEYKLWLRTFAEAQMDAYELGWGWFYWTWRTEDAAGWSYVHGLEHGFMPELAYERAFACGDAVPDFGGLPEWY